MQQSIQAIPRCRGGLPPCPRRPSEPHRGARLIGFLELTQAAQEALPYSTVWPSRAERSLALVQPAMRCASPAALTTPRRSPALPSSARWPRTFISSRFDSHGAATESARGTRPCARVGAGRSRDTSSLRARLLRCAVDAALAALDGWTPPAGAPSIRRVSRRPCSTSATRAPKPDPVGAGADAVPMRF